jgi:hypothetical protein
MDIAELVQEFEAASGVADWELEAWFNNWYEQEEEERFETPPPPRKRRQFRKPRLPIVVDLTSPTKDLDSVKRKLEFKTPTPLKRGRGRPPKRRQIEEDAQISVEPVPLLASQVVLEPTALT